SPPARRDPDSRLSGLPGKDLAGARVLEGGWTPGEDFHRLLGDVDRDLGDPLAVEPVEQLPDAGLRRAEVLEEHGEVAVAVEVARVEDVAVPAGELRHEHEWLPSRGRDVDLPALAHRDAPYRARSGGAAAGPTPNVRPATS